MPSAKASVLLIEDDMPLRKYLRTVLAGAGYAVTEAENGELGLKFARQTAPTLIILDLGLPDVDGQDVLVRLRERVESLIIVLSGRDEPLDKITALDHGADDYLTKPFSSGELLARLRLALRHAAQGQKEGDSPVFEFGDVQVNITTRRVFVRKSEAHLTPIEFNLLAMLIRNAGKVVSYHQLIREVWPTKPDTDPQTVRVFIAGLRRKIEADPARPCHLLTEQGVGYRLVLHEAAAC